MRALEPHGQSIQLAGKADKGGEDMDAVRWLAWASFGVAALCVCLAAAYEQVAFLAAAFSAVLTGVLLQAVDLALVRLTEIRDAVRQAGPAARDAGAPSATSTAASLDTRLETSLDDLERRLQKARGS